VRDGPADVVAAARFFPNRRVNQPLDHASQLAGIGAAMIEEDRNDTVIRETLAFGRASIGENVDQILGGAAEWRGARSFRLDDCCRVFEQVGVLVILGEVQVLDIKGAALGHRDLGRRDKIALDHAGTLKAPILSKGVRYALKDRRRDVVWLHRAVDRRVNATGLIGGQPGFLLRAGQRPVEPVRQPKTNPRRNTGRAGQAPVTGGTLQLRWQQCGNRLGQRTEPHAPNGKRPRQR
jgi:hypothetical protein